MHLKSLTIRGFKSFASATTFDFEPGVTAVVGPNGSGKSNVVDALAWVMGEQGAKSLRGGSMEDVIFAGTAERQPLGRASVSLTIDNADGVLPIEYAEVTISRTMFRSGGSEYTINSRKCRLLDIQELLSDSGLGREMHVIVGQGQLDQILHATPEQRRGFIEEAAGVLKHRRRRDRTARKLESMQGNLERLHDLVGEISRQLAPLGRQAKVARRAQRIQHDVRDALSRLIADDLVRISTQLHESAGSEEADRAELAQLREAISVCDEELEELNQRAAAQQSTAQALAEGHHRVERVQERLRSVASLARERSGSLLAASRVEPSGRDPQKLRDQAEAVAAEADEAAGAVDVARSALEDATAQRAEAEEQLNAEEERLRGLLRAAADRRAGLARLEGQLNTAQNSIESAQDRYRRASEQHDAAVVTRDDAHAEFTELEQSIAGIETGEAGLDEAYENAVQAHEQIRAHYDDLTAQQAQLAGEITELSARLSGLQAAAAPRDGAAALHRDYPHTVGDRLAETISIEPGWETAVALCLGSLDTALLAPDAQSAEHALQWLQEHDAGRAQLVYPEPRSADTSGGDQQDIQAASRGAEPDGPSSSSLREYSAVRACDVVEVPDDIAEPVYAVLRGAVLCTEATAARQLLQYEGVTMVVTTAGEIVRRGHREGGTASVHHEISITAQIQQLTQTREQTQARQGQVQTLIEQAEAQIRESEAQVNETLEALHASDADLHATTERLGRLRTDISTAQERLRAAEEEAAAAREAEGRGRAEHAAAQSRLEAAREDDTEEDPSTDDRDRLAETASARRQREVDARLTLRAGEDRHSQLGERAAALRRSAQAEESRAAQARALAQDRRMRAAEAEAVQAEAEDAVVSLDDTLRRSAAAREAAQAAHAGLAAEITDVSRRRQEQAERADGITSQLHAAELARTELRLSLEAAESRGREELSLSPEYLIEHYGPDQLIPDQALPADAVNDHAVNDHTAPEQTGDADSAGTAPQVQEPTGKAFDRGEQEKRLAAARKDLSALGKVNPLALEEHAALEERHRYLQEQLADLTSTRKDLLGIIDDIDRTVEQVFREAWEDTRVQFEHVFARLFPGGEGRLELTDPDDMLNTGIEVHARPPGKRIRRLSLLSGGERSLTAVALLVAIFKARPSPFYVMDEVEAALDDTNLSRLLVVFEELRESSQLIVITHQKRTMEVADALYGVSMRQDGSTRVISQRLERQESTP